MIPTYLHCHKSILLLFVKEIIIKKFMYFYENISNNDVIV